jgi:hypothetical protein
MLISVDVHFIVVTVGYLAECLPAYVAGLQVIKADTDPALLFVWQIESHKEYLT